LPPKPPTPLDKAAIVEHLHRLGRHDDAVRADIELDNRLYTAQESALLERFGIDPSDVGDETYRTRPPPDY
jgi:hypothetical protein